MAGGKKHLGLITCLLKVIISYKNLFYEYGKNGINILTAVGLSIFSGFLHLTFITFVIRKVVNLFKNLLEDRVEKQKKKECGTYY